MGRKQLQDRLLPKGTTWWLRVRIQEHLLCFKNLPTALLTHRSPQKGGNNLCKPGKSAWAEHSGCKEYVHNYCSGWTWVSFPA